VAVFGIGPDGLLLVPALAVSILLAALAWRRTALWTTAVATAILAIAFGIWMARLPNTSHPLVASLFVIVPSVLLIGATRVRWIAQHAWILLLAGPIVFVGCYCGVCELCVKTGLI
jgi:hypothetical protein